MNKDELEILYGFDEFLFKLYFAGIRRYMDYQTGIVGVKRKISWLSLREMMRIEPQAGVKEYLPDRNRVRRGVNTLERIGLIKNKSNGKRLIFECVLATRDKSVLEEGGQDPTHHLGQQIDPKKKVRNSAKTGVSGHIKLQADPEADTHLPPQADPPPLSVKELKEKQTLRVCKKKLPDDFGVTDQHMILANKNEWPDPHSEIEAFKDHHLAKGTLFADWDRAFYTWLRNAKKFKARENFHGRRNQPGGDTKQNSMSRAIDNILNSPSRSKTD